MMSLMPFMFGNAAHIPPKKRSRFLGNYLARLEQCRDLDRITENAGEADYSVPSTSLEDGALEKDSEGEKINPIQNPPNTQGGKKLVLRLQITEAAYDRSKLQGASSGYGRPALFEFKKVQSGPSPPVVGSKKLRSKRGGGARKPISKRKRGKRNKNQTSGSGISPKAVQEFVNTRTIPSNRWTAEEDAVVFSVLETNRGDNYKELSLEILAKLGPETNRNSNGVRARIRKLRSDAEKGRQC